MENQFNTPQNSNENPRPNPPLNSLDGFARPTPTPTPSSSNDTNQINSPLPTPPASNPSQPPDRVDSPQQPATKPVVIGSAQKKSKIWTTILVILILIIFAGGVYGVYAYQQKKINTDASKIVLLTSSNASLASKYAKASASTNSTTTTTSQSSTTSGLTTFKVPELGISLSVPTNLADLSYIANSTKTQVNLSNQDLSTLDAKCSASTTVAPLGSITKGTGQFPTSSSSTTTLIKQYSTYYIAYVQPSGSCSAVTQVNSLATSLVTSLKGTFPTIQVITS